MRKISLAAVKAALASSKTPPALKRGLLKKYGHLLGSTKLSMSTLASTMSTNPKKKKKKKSTKHFAYTERQAASVPRWNIDNEDLGFMSPGFSTHYDPKMAEIGNLRKKNPPKEKRLFISCGMV